MQILKFILGIFHDTLLGHVCLVVFLFAVMGERRLRRLKKLPLLLISPAVTAVITWGLYVLIPEKTELRYSLSSFAIMLMCTLWVRWAWQTGGLRAFAVVCMAGTFQVAVSCLSGILSNRTPLGEDSMLWVVEFVFLAVTVCGAALLYALRFHDWFFCVLDSDPGQLRTALFFFAQVVVMETFYWLQRGLESRYLLAWYVLVLVMICLIACLVMYMGKQLDAMERLQMQKDVMVRQKLYESDLEAIRKEVQGFRHDYRNLLAGMAEQARAGDMEELGRTLEELDAGFERCIGEKIRASAQIGNLQVLQLRSLVLTKMADMKAKGVECRLEVIYPVTYVPMDVWDFVRCLGVFLDNAVEAALCTERPWVEILLLAQRNVLSLRVSNAWDGKGDPVRFWDEGFSTKGSGRGTGLSGCRRILERCPNAGSDTEWGPDMFVQKLTVEELP